MTKKNAIGAIEMLLMLLIVGIIAATLIPIFRSSSLSTKSAVDNKSIQENIDEQVNQIENLRKQHNEMLENMNQDY